MIFLTDLVEALVTEGLTKRYGKITAVDRLDMKVEAGSIHGFLGPNGAGKTTTIKLILGLLNADSGLITLFGERLEQYRPELRLRIGYMPELPRFPKHLTAYELLDIYGEMYRMTEQERRNKIPKLLELVKLKDRAKEPIGRYSKGMQQRLGMAQSMLGDPELLILDEPTLGLDPVGMVETRELLKQIKREGTTIFLSSHLLHEVEQVCTHCTIINHGRALASGTLEEVSKLGQSLEDVFIKLVSRTPGG